MATRTVFTPAWDADARTIEALHRDGAFEFTIAAASVGIVCGLAESNASQNYLFIDYAFLIEEGKYKILERGLAKTGTLGSCTNETVFEIRRSRGEVKYYVNTFWVYTSSTRNNKPLFGDCSLYYFNDTILTAEITNQLAGGGNAEGVAPVGIGARGLAVDGNFGIARVIVWARGDEGDTTKGRAPVGVGAFGAEPADYCGGIAPVHVGARGIDHEIRPEYNAGTAGLWIRATGNDWQEQSGGLAPVAVGAVGIGADDGNVGRAGVGVGAVGIVWLKSQIIVNVPEFWATMTLGNVLDATLPLIEMEAEGTAGDVGILDATLPLIEMMMTGGAVLDATLPLIEMEATGTSLNAAVLDAELPIIEMEATGTAGVLAWIDASLPLIEMVLEGGGELGGTLPEIECVMDGCALLAASLDATLPWIEMVAEGSAALSGKLDAELPLMEMVAVGRVESTRGILDATLPLIEMAAYGPGYGPGAEAGVGVGVTYAVNIHTKAVTRWKLAPVNQLLSAHGALWGRIDNRLVLFSQNMDGDKFIKTRVRFAQTTAGIEAIKRCREIHLLVRENDGVVVSMIADERTQWAFRSDFDTAGSIGTYRVKLGGGITFHSLGIVLENRNGGALSVGGFTLLMEALSRGQL